VQQDPLYVINRCKDKIWTYKDQIIEEDEDFFLTGAASATSLTLSSALAVIYGGTGTTTSTGTGSVVLSTSPTGGNSDDKVACVGDAFKHI
jgi:hypothetical protein